MTDHQSPRQLCGMEISELPDGRLCMTRVDPSSTGALVGCVGCAFTGCGLLIAVAMAGLIPNVHTSRRGHIIQPFENWTWLIPALGALAGLSMVRAGFMSMFGKESWVVSHNSMEIRTQVLGVGGRQTWRDSEIKLQCQMTGTYRQRPYYTLWLSRPHTLSARSLGTNSDSTPDDLKALAKLLTERTGWPFIEY